MHIFQSSHSKTLKEMVEPNRGNIVYFCMGTNMDHYSLASDLLSLSENEEPDMRGALGVTKGKGFSTHNLS